MGSSSRSWLWCAQLKGEEERGRVCPFSFLTSPATLFSQHWRAPRSQWKRLRTVGFLWTQTTRNSPSERGALCNSGENQASSKLVREKATYTYSHFRNQFLSLPWFLTTAYPTNTDCKRSFQTLSSSLCLKPGAQRERPPCLRSLGGSDNFSEHINEWFLHCETISHAMHSPLVQYVCFSVQMPFSPSAAERKNLLTL